MSGHPVVVRAFGAHVRQEPGIGRIPHPRVVVDDLSRHADSASSARSGRSAVRCRLVGMAGTLAGRTWPFNGGSDEHIPSRPARQDAVPCSPAPRRSSSSRWLRPRLWPIRRRRRRRRASGAARPVAAGAPSVPAGQQDVHDRHPSATDDSLNPFSGFLVTSATRSTADTYDTCRTAVGRRTSAPSPGLATKSGTHAGRSHLDVHDPAGREVVRR